MKHFKLTNETRVNAFGVTLFRIELTIDCKWGKAGDKGGWIEKEGNLSGNAWVYGDAWVYGNARVYGDALVSGDARVYGDAWVYGNARVYGDAWVSGNARVYGNARVSGDALVSGNARVYGDAWVSGNARVSGNALVESSNDYCALQSFGSENRTTTFFKTKTKEIAVKCGCFEGNLTEFEARVKSVHGDNKPGQEYMAIIALVKIKFGI